MPRPHVLHIRNCKNCWEMFSTYEKHSLYCDNCGYMETTEEWRARCDDQIEKVAELVIA